MKKLAKLAGTLPFAHLLGVKAAAEDEEEKKDARKAEDDGDDEQARSSKAESDDERPEDEDGDKDTVKKSKKAEKDGDSDDDDVERMAAARERARCAAIVAHGIKTGQVVHAGTYAFNTDMSAEAAIATLDANLALAPSKPGAATLADRMNAVNTPVVKPEGEAPAGGTSAQAIAAQVNAAAAKARGEKA
ncbi:hypothetical protein [uncultured Pseudacidovorax sp.]|uniref:hypothetical protein n=1 Tax=uncultured Pseudacidovorax sp. TaxID=679313 RepID=UPI0025D6F43F|nr:hypothetical protein [uncultured Pseudacidovorax sp.]